MHKSAFSRTKTQSASGGPDHKPNPNSLRQIKMSYRTSQLDVLVNLFLISSCNSNHVIFLMFRSVRVRIKAPSVKDVLDFDDPDVGSLDQPKNDESKVAEQERSVMRIKNHI